MANYPQNLYSAQMAGYPQPIAGTQIQYQPQMQQPAPQPTPTIRTVYSEAEARAAQIPIDGSTYIFLDTANNRIYAKRFDYSNGSFPLTIYQQVQPSIAQTGQYVTLEQFQAWRTEIENRLPKLIDIGGANGNE